MSDQKILVQILEQQKKTNKLLQAIVSSQEQQNIFFEADGECFVKAKVGFADIGTFKLVPFQPTEY